VDLVKRWLLIGLGLAALTKEKAEEIVLDLVQRGEMSREEGKSLIDNVLRRTDAGKHEVRDRLHAEVRRFLKGTGIAARDDIENLRAEIEALNTRLTELEGRIVQDTETEPQ